MTDKESRSQSIASASRRAREQPRDAAGRFIARVNDIAQGLPGADRVRSRFEVAESFVLRELKNRLDRVDAKSPQPMTYGDDSEPLYDASPNGLSDRMGRLLERAGEQSADAAMVELFHRLLDEITSDEARIIGALSDGSARPLLNVGIAPLIGPVTRLVAENFSDVGKQALVKLRDQTPSYIAHLLNMGLLEIGPELDDMDVKYQILETDGVLKRAVEQAEAEPGGRAKLLRRSVRLSALGQQFWAACQPDAQ